MTPPDQRLAGNHNPIRQPYLGLIYQEKLTIFQRLREALLQIAADLGFLIHLRGKELEIIALPLFGRVHGLVCLVE